ncbi:HDIG domain-containing protein, partial [Patescibacteria group bacterium]|nr:HDIG domain-containing protein [Patescibacteria group bacterium]
RRPDPTKLVWGKTINEDLKRRDFTINAMALKFIKKDEYELIDPFKGLDDLNQHFIKTVGDPTQRFKEDALRMLRAERFAVQLNMQISDQTFEAIINHGQLITKISWERISDEFLKILASQYPAEGIKLLDESGLLQFVLPEILQGKAVSQGGHHTTDVWTHSLDSIKECPNPDPIVRLATLLHDVAKPQTFAIRNDKITFYNHEIIGSRMADTIAKRFKLPNAQRKQLFTLVRYHMFYYQPHHTDAAIRRFMRKVGLENIDEILDLREADRLGSGARKTSWRLEEMKQRMVEQLNQPMEVTDLDINGYDLMKEFALKSGPWIGEVLNKLLEKVLDEPELNKKDELMTLAKELIKQN